ncbi:sulfite exporter TauE/SafE family protein [Alteromonas oceanisediminis]|uniref:sulfite exporter TauE/SafE family protein n=1 Tax=Alteromonas oceanisediminis TaxID=2836180 RepID=UPI001BD94DA2|nr:sulfite exporter TauE/SafE family protein [Alteromonas oceanisediminis]MBT0587468.1 sulfite exporter TauE/SafE family protein [Alteromonas oceanisediminis]
MAWCVLVLWQPNSIALLQTYGAFSALGVTGAIFANATGAGGGVVFVPFFNHLGFTATTIVATSFAIQCCGMTAGAVTWYRFYRAQHRADTQWSSLLAVLLLTIPTSWAGIWTVQLLEFSDQFNLHKDGVQQLHLWFGIFSIVLACAIYASIPLLKRVSFSTSLTSLDKPLLLLIGFLGGMVTAWLSVGVGELVAVYLIVRGFNVTFAIASAVILSAFSVWGAVVYHIEFSQAIYWPVVLFAGAGAVIGGIVAKRVVLMFSVTKLKLFFATWVLLLGISGLPVF